MTSIFRSRSSIKSRLICGVTAISVLFLLLPGPELPTRILPSGARVVSASIVPATPDHPPSSPATSPTISPDITRSFDVSDLELVSVGKDHIIVTWNTDVPVGTYAECGDTTYEDNTPTLYHQAAFAGLDPGTAYEVNVTDGENVLKSREFRTPERPFGDRLFRFAVVTDTHFKDADYEHDAIGKMSGHSGALLDEMISAVNREDVAFTILKGDLTETGTISQCDAVERRLDGLNSHYYTAFGNHDLGSESHSLWYGENRDKRYYSFEHMGYYFIVLDSGTGTLNETQTDWLNDTLETNRDKPTMIYLHHLVNPIPGLTHDEHGKERVPGILLSNHADVRGVLASHPNVISVNSGHAHINSVTTDPDTEDTKYIVSASLIQYPIGYNIFDVYSTGYTQVFHKLLSNLSESEKSREAMYDYAYDKAYEEYQNETLANYIAEATIRLTFGAALSDRTVTVTNTVTPPPPGSGDWHIRGDLSVKDTTLGLKGDLIIHRGGNLSLDNVRLDLTRTKGAGHRIKVLTGGELHTRNGSVVTAEEIRLDHGYVTMEDSETVNTGIVLADTAHAVLSNTSFNSSRVRFEDPESDLEVRWNLRIDPVDRDLEPLYDPRVKVYNSSRTPVFDGPVERSRPVALTAYVLSKEGSDRSMNPYTLYAAADTNYGTIEEVRSVDMREPTTISIIFSLGPCVIRPIPDVTLSEDEELPGAFDCTDHFDDNGTTTNLSFYPEGNENIDVHIDSKGVAGLSPAADWNGKENITVIGENTVSGISARISFTVSVRATEDPPVPMISGPAANASYFSNETIILDGSGRYDVDGDVPVFYWHSNLSGGLGNGSITEVSLDIGLHLITLYVSDGMFNESLSMIVRVGNSPPAARIFSPENNTFFNETVPVTFNGSTSRDGEDDPDELNYTWRSDIDGLLGYGAGIEKTLSPGQHNVALAVRDSYGDTSRAIVVITVTPKETNASEDNDDENPEHAQSDSEPDVNGTGKDGGGSGGQGRKGGDTGLIAVVVTTFLLFIAGAAILMSRKRKPGNVKDGEQGRSAEEREEVEREEVEWDDL